MTVTGADPILIDTVTRMLEERCGPEVVARAEAGEWPHELWQAFEEAGLTLAWVPEAGGGAGGTFADGFAITRLTGRHAAPVPVAETLLAGWLLSSLDLSAPPGPLTVAWQGRVELNEDGTLSGRAARVRFGSRAEHLAVLARSDGAMAVALVCTASCERLPGSNLAGESSDEVRFDRVEPVSLARDVGASLPESLRRMGALVRVQQMAGALEGILELAVRYAGERRQFGRPLAKFHAVQHNLAVLAGESSAAGAAADAAAMSLARHGVDDLHTFLAIASAKIRAGEAAGTGAGIGHQVHGAIGFTREYPLHHFTRRLWAWRDEFDAESVWADEFGRLVAARGADRLWSDLTAI